jgi:hypothetical protein
MSLTGLTTAGAPDRCDGRVADDDTNLLAAFADRVAWHRAAAGGSPDPAVGADTVRELLAVVEALTRREVARRAGRTRSR